ncbi:hypothetical protein [Chondromyces crocatus]|uniref:Uncharacterized protein n=1 Tax=Chondromyces crocatus TaxID=52 RepID=A0A0K1EU90_CHOCO|nr:hypothetical protein [Chondromyces crocatus]AKT44217.1 uncharacterized protein CMC5_084570 [Chondromyces crocatus]
MKGWWFAVVLAAALPSCSRSGGSGSHRAEVKPVGPESVQIVPASGQLPYCLAFTVSEHRVIRQLTMAADRQAVPCSANEPIAGLTYRIPAEEGKVRVIVLFSDQPVKADPIAAQIFEIASVGRQVTAFDLRVPGKVVLETLHFTPSSGVPSDAVEGDAVVSDAGAAGDGAPVNDTGGMDAGTDAAP